MVKDKTVADLRKEKEAQKEQFKLNIEKQRQELLMYQELFNFAFDNSPALSGRNMGSVGGFDKKDITGYLENPSKNKKEIINLSRMLYSMDGIYKNLIDFHADILNLEYILVPQFDIPFDDGEPTQKSAKNIKRLYREKDKVKEYIGRLLETATIRSALRQVAKEGAYYGLVRETKTGVKYLQTLDRHKCKFSGYGDGIPCFAYDFSIFDDDKKLLNEYPKEFVALYRQYKNNGEEYQVVPPHLGLCLQYNDTDHALPLFSGGLIALLDDKDFYEFLSRNADLETIRLVIQKAGVDENGEPNVSPAILKWFNDQLQSKFGDSIKVASTIFDIEPIDFTSSNGGNKDLGVEFVDNKTRSSLSASGIITGESDTEYGLTQSINNTVRKMFTLLEKVARWINYILQEEFKGNKLWTVEYIPITKDGMSQVAKNLENMLTMGGSLVYALLGTGVNVDNYINMLKLEKVTQMKSLLDVVQTSHTTSGQDEGGRPKGSKDGDEEGGE